MKKIKQSALIAFCCLLMAGVCRADQFCFLTAENYYEQLYCELQARGLSKGLPKFYEFQNNDELTQAFLLKRPAAKAGIKLSMPKRTAKRASPQAPQRAVQKAPKRTLQKTPQYTEPSSPAPATAQRHAAATRSAPMAAVVRALSGCQLNGIAILCGQKTYRLTGNKKNRTLTSGALESGNKLAMQPYSPAIAGGPKLMQYLRAQYHRYLEKMLEIGLGGATFSFNKFVFFFHNVTEKGVNFTDRFETMYSYLKKDKQRLAVSEAIPSEVGVSLTDCLDFGDTMIACAAGRKNYLFLSGN